MDGVMLSAATRGSAHEKHSYDAHEGASENCEHRDDGSGRRTTKHDNKDDRTKAREEEGHKGRCLDPLGQPRGPAQAGQVRVAKRGLEFLPVPRTVVEGDEILEEGPEPDALARHAAHLPECSPQAVERSARDADLRLPAGDAGQDEVVQLAHGADLLRLLVADGDVERLFDAHHHG